MSALALAAVTVVSAVSFARVFGEVSSVVPGVLAGIFVHTLLRGIDRFRVPPVIGGTALITGGMLLMAWTVAPHTTELGFPTVSTVQLLGERLSDGFGAIRTADVPIGPHNGIVLVSALGVFIAAIAADWVAFRARAVLSACIPAATLFTLTAALGTERSQTPLTIAFAAAALTFVLAHAPAHAGEEYSWFASDTRERGPGAVLRAGLPLVVVAALLAPVLGPRLPEARSAGLVELAPGAGGPKTRVTVSPLVDIRDRLTQSPPIDVFTVTASRPAYWRMAALEAFDGDIWKSEANYERADDDLPADTAAPVHTLVQDYAISNLSQFWLPAAYRPSTIDLGGARVNPESLTLLTDQPTSDGLRYRVESSVPTYGPGDLNGETGRVPDDVRPFLLLPLTFPGVVAGLAADVTAGHRTVYEKSLALQNFFRQEFAYSEEVPPGHSGSRLVDFLFTARTGFCEQFAASFAAMARSLGIPARVAVGFTPGALDPGGTTFRVTTENAHAWPEVYIDPYGWVAFEPTPTRFNPSPSDHTGTFNAEAQQSPQPPDPAATATTVAPGSGDLVAENTPPPRSETTGGGGRSDEGSAWPRRILIGAVTVLALLILAAAAVFEMTRRARRKKLETLDEAGSILMAWDDVIEHCKLDGIALAPTLTPAEAARVAASREPEAADALDGLSRLVDMAAYAPGEPDGRDVATAWIAARQVVEVLERDDTTGRKLRRRLLARP